MFATPGYIQFQINLASLVLGAIERINISRYKKRSKKWIYAEVSIIDVLSKLKSNHIVFCPMCGEELFMDATSLKTDFLVCKNEKCFTYFEKYKGKKELKELGSYLTVLNDMANKGLGKWPGIPTSIAYKPRWIKIIELIVRKR